MKKIVSWTLGSFFRTLGRFIFYILIGALVAYVLKDVKLPSIFNVLDVYAYNDDGWFDNIEHYGATTFFFYNHNSNGYTEMSSTSSQMVLQYQYVQDSNDYLERTYWFPYVSSANIATNGVSISYYVEQLFAQGYLYNLTSYVCFGSNASSITPSVTTGYSATNAIGHTMGYHVSVKQAIASQNWGDYSLNNCYAITSLISSTGTYPWVNLRFTNPSNLQTSIKFIGYNVEALGIYNASLQQYVQNAINNSGLATASSVSDVNRAVDSVRSELEGVGTDIQNQTQQQQENHEETMNTMTDETPPNTNSMSNSAVVGWLPAGPVDSIINLPLTMLNTIYSNLGGSCAGIQLTVPFINEQWTLPCISNLYARIEGLPALINSLGIVMSAFMLYQYLLYLYHWCEKRISLKGDNDAMWGE